MNSSAPATQPAVCLCDAPRGTQVTISRIEGHDELSCHLYSMGFCENAQVTLEKSGNPCIVSIGATRVAIDRGLLQRVVVDTLAASTQSESIISGAVKAAKDALSADNSCGNVALPQ